MRAIDALPQGTLAFLDTAPLVYFVERVSPFFSITEAIFQRIDTGEIRVVTSPVTLAECLVVPLRKGDTKLQHLFVDFITAGPNTAFVEINATIAHTVADLRARYNLALSDSFQIAVALSTRCNAFLTNDTRLQRVAEIRVLILEDLDV
ncbi:MAG: type II toxin-antitoxin system VapC family toxin [Chloroflexi bacterium]|nr:type II toxin-antitoxin system VapC family toxin [Chloroflexota bacterium]